MINALTVVNEGTTSYIRVSFTDQDGDDLVPSSITYRVDDLGSGQNLVPATSITPDAGVEIRIPPAINSLIAQGASSETRVATIEASYGAHDDVLIDEVRWLVKNLRFKE